MLRSSPVVRPLHGDRPVERPLVSRHSGVLLPPARNGGSRAHGAPRVPGAHRAAPAGEAVAPEAKACIRILVVDDEYLLRESCATCPATSLRCSARRRRSAAPSSWPARSPPPTPPSSSPARAAAARR